MDLNHFIEPITALSMNIRSIQSMLIGNILGDSFIGRNSLGTFISFEQSLAKASYLRHLHDRVAAEGLAKSDRVKYDRTDKRYPGTVNSSLYFRTISTPELDFLSDLFLDQSNKKVIPGNIADFLDAEALAY